MGGINENKSGDPIQVSLEDIQNVATRGKWWLVGSAWKGHETDKPKDVDVVAMVIFWIMLNQTGWNWPNHKE